MPSQGTSTFDLFALRFRFAASKPVHFPANETANLFRGQFGKALYRTNPTAYARLFAPVADAGPSGLHDSPRPFVFRVRHLQGETLANYEVGMNLFDTNDAPIEAIREALGAGVPVSTLVTLSLAPTRQADRIRVAFLTPTELKNSDTPDFGPLFARIRDRVSTLRALYGPGPLEIDFKAMGERANHIEMTRCEIRHVDAERVSRNTGQRHSLGGFVGVAEYEGDLTDFLPYLEIAVYTGVGRQTVWGKGEISVETF